MEKSIFWKLTWPSNSKMQVLGEILDVETLFKLIKHFRNRKQEDRIVRFPKDSTLKKLVAFYYGCEVESGRITWSEVMRKLRGEEKFLKDAGLSRKSIKKLFAQKKKELLKEKRREK